MRTRTILFGTGLAATAAGLASQAIPISGADPGLVEASVTYSGCNEVRALGKAPLYAGEPGYRLDFDGDGDGVACEPHP